MDERPTYVLRVWLPDRPGALGAVASRIGSVGGDVAGIEVVDRDGGQAIDELTVELPDRALLELLIREVDEVDGVHVEDIRPVDGRRMSRTALLETAAELVQAADEQQLIAVLCARAYDDLAATWTAVVELDGGRLVCTAGTPPEPDWLVAFARGAAAASVTNGCEDVAWAPLVPERLTVVAGRDGVAFRPTERAELAALVRVAAIRFVEVSGDRAVPD
jgi:hypothetical protein